MPWWWHASGRRVVLAGSAVAMLGLLGAGWALARAFEDEGAGPVRLQERYVRVERAGTAAVEPVHDPNGAP